VTILRTRYIGEVEHESEALNTGTMSLEADRGNSAGGCDWPSREGETFLRESRAGELFSFIPTLFQINLIGLSKASIPMNEADRLEVRHQIAANQKGISQKTLNQPLKRITKPNLISDLSASSLTAAHHPSLQPPPLDQR
jgi:hypothetical protein